MIRINLLPAEFQKPEGPPPGRLAVIFVDLVVLGGAMSLFLPLLFIRVPNAREEKNQVLTALGTKLRESKAQDGTRIKLDATAAETTAYAQLLREHPVSLSRELERLHTGLGAERAWLESLRAVPGAVDGGVAFEATFAVPNDDLDAVRALRAALVKQGWQVQTGGRLAMEARDHDVEGARFEERVRLAVTLVLAAPASASRGEGSGR